MDVDNDPSVASSPAGAAAAPNANTNNNNKRRSAEFEGDDEGDEGIRLAIAYSLGIEPPRPRPRANPSARHSAEALFIVLERQRHLACQARARARRMLTAQIEATAAAATTAPPHLTEWRRRGEHDEDGVGGQVTGGGWRRSIWLDGRRRRHENDDDEGGAGNGSSSDSGNEDSCGAGGQAAIFRSMLETCALVCRAWRATTCRAADRAVLGIPDCGRTHTSSQNPIAALDASSAGSLRALFLKGSLPPFGANDRRAVEQVGREVLSAAAKAIKRQAMQQDAGVLSVLRALRVLRVEVGRPLVAGLAAFPLSRAFSATPVFQNLVHLELERWLSVWVGEEGNVKTNKEMTKEKKKGDDAAAAPATAAATAPNKNNNKQEQQQQQPRPKRRRAHARRRRGNNTKSKTTTSLASFFTHANFPSLRVLSVTLAPGSNCPLDLAGGAAGGAADDSPPPLLERLCVVPSDSFPRLIPSSWPHGEPMLVSLASLQALKRTLTNLWAGFVYAGPDPLASSSSSSSIRSPLAPGPVTFPGSALWYDAARYGGGGTGGAAAPAGGPVAAAATSTPPPPSLALAPMGRLIPGLSHLSRLTSIYFDSAYDWNPLPAFKPLAPAARESWRRRWRLDAAALFSGMRTSLVRLEIRDDATGGDLEAHEESEDDDDYEEEQQAQRRRRRKIERATKAAAVVLPRALSLLGALTNLDVRCHRIVSGGAALGGLTALRRLVLVSKHYGEEKEAAVVVAAAAPTTAAAAAPAPAAILVPAAQLGAAALAALAEPGGGQPIPLTHQDVLADILPAPALPQPPPAPPAPPAPPPPPPHMPLCGRELARLSRLETLRLSHVSPCLAYPLAHCLPKLERVVLRSGPEEPPTIVLRALWRRLQLGGPGDDDDDEEDSLQREFTLFFDEKDADPPGLWETDTGYLSQLIYDDGETPSDEDDFAAPGWDED